MLMMSPSGPNRVTALAANPGVVFANFLQADVCIQHMEACAVVGVWP